MKNIKSIFYISAALVLFNSCAEDFLDRPLKNQLSVDVLYQNLENIEGAVLGLYERGRSHLESNDICLYKTLNTDLVQGGTHITDQAVFNQMATFTNFHAGNSGIRDIWNANYTGLHRANEILENTDNVIISEGNSEEVQRRNTVKGSALFFRAYFHLDLIQRWDNIVLSNAVYTDPNYKYSLAEKDEVYDLIVSDLEEAILLLQQANAIGTNGQISQGTAHHVLSIALMDIGDYAGAAEHAEAVINDGYYELVDVNTVHNYTEKENKEIIFSWQFTQSDRNHPQRTSQQFYPLYDRCNGVARSFAQGGRPWARLSPTEYYWTLFEEDDLRLDAWHKRFWIYDTDETADPLPAGVSLGDTVTPENIEEVAGLGALIIEPTTAKYREDSVLGRSIDDADGFRNIIEYRLSQAYIIAAEAHLRNGNAAAGQPYLDAVRARAGVDPIDLNEQNILDEQARELAHEGHRYAMLKRLGIIETSVKEHSPEIGNSMLPHNVRWPIPQNFIDLTKVPQNEGYE